jgi:hypothetical protein
MVRPDLALFMFISRHLPLPLPSSFLFTLRPTMFKQKPPQPTTTPDHTRSLRDPQFYRFGHLRSLGLQGDLSALAYDPLLGLLAAGTTTGLVHLSGTPAFQCTITLYPHGHAATSAQARNEIAAGVKLMAFQPGERLIVIDTRNTVHIWALAPGKMDDAKGLPRKTMTMSLYGDAVFMDQPTPVSGHVGVTFRDGNVVWVDMERVCVAPYK